MQADHVTLPFSPLPAAVYTCRFFPLGARVHVRVHVCMASFGVNFNGS